MVSAERTAVRNLDTSVLEALRVPPAEAEVVIIGGGIIGASIACHLTERGVRDVVVLERGELTNGTTWHAAGLVLQLRGTRVLSRLCAGSADAYERVSRETGIDVGLRRVGSIAVAQTTERMQEMRLRLSVARDVGIEAHALTSSEIRDVWPAASVDDLTGGVLFPGDATINPGDAALAFAKAACDRGARLVQGVAATGFEAHQQRLTHVATNRGRIATQCAVLATGLWTSELARSANLSLALYPAEHVWMTTDVRPSANQDVPALRDLDGYFYVRHYQGGYLLGAFEPDGRPRAPRTISTAGYAEFGPDWAHVGPVVAKARERIPDLVDAKLTYQLRAPESFTPDSNPLLGEVPELGGLFVAAGMNSAGIGFAPGVGQALAAWIVEGAPPDDVSDVDVARFGRWANDRRWLHERTSESLGRLYDLHWPSLQPTKARGVRRMPLEAELTAAGAAFAEIDGWERPAWYEPSSVTTPEWGYDFDHPSWHDSVRDEMRAVRTRVGIFDLSTYAKFLIQGPGSCAALQYLCANNVDVPPGVIVYTTICNERGGIELDLTVTRLDDEAFFAVASTNLQRRAETLLRNGVGSRAIVTDVTSGYATLHVAGPSSRTLLESIVDAAFDNDASPFLSAQEIEIGRSKAWALRVSYTGELGWEIYVPTEFAAAAYRDILDKSEDFDLFHCGSFALNALGLERGYRSWGHDISMSDDPYAAGLGFTVDLKKVEVFQGVDALTRIAADRRQRRLISFVVEDSAIIAWGGESLLRDGERVGYVARAAYGFTLGASVGLAWVTGGSQIRDSWLDGSEWTLEVRDEVVPIRVSLRPFYDPLGERSRI